RFRIWIFAKTCGDERRFYPARADTVHPDAMRRMINRQRLRQSHYRKLRCAVCKPIGNAKDAADRGHVHDCSSAPGEHPSDERLRDVESPAAIATIQSIDLGSVRLCDRAPMPYSGVVDEDINRSDLSGYVRAIRLVRDI